MTRRISQREATRYRKRAVFLEQILMNERKLWGPEFLWGQDIGRATWNSDGAIPVAIRTARKLKHAVIATADDDGTVCFHALPLAEIPK